MDPYPETRSILPDFHDRFTTHLIYPIQLPAPLPTISIPLLPGDGEVAVSLQKVFERTYTSGPYHREVDYAETVPLPELSPEETHWVKERVAKS